MVSPCPRSNLSTIYSSASLLSFWTGKWLHKICSTAIWNILKLPKIQSVIITHKFYICKSAKHTCNSKSMLAALSRPFVDTHKGVKNQLNKTWMFSAGKTKQHLPSCFLFHTINKCSICSLLSAMFSTFLWLFLNDFTIKMVPKSSTKAAQCS